MLQRYLSSLTDNLAGHPADMGFVHCMLGYWCLTTAGHVGSKVVIQAVVKFSSNGTVTEADWLFKSTLANYRQTGPAGT